MKFKIRALSLALILALSYAAHASAPALAYSTKVSETFSVHSYKDSEILEGILFGEGEYAEKIGISVSLDRSKTSETLDSERKPKKLVLDGVLSDSKSDRFIGDLRSENPYTVKRGLAVLQESVNNVASKLFSDKPVSSAKYSPNAFCRPIACGLAVYVVAAVQFAVVTGTWLWVGRKLSQSAEVSLSAKIAKSSR